LIGQDSKITEVDSKCIILPVENLLYLGTRKSHGMQNNAGAHLKIMGRPMMEFFAVLARIDAVDSGSDTPPKGFNVERGKGLEDNLREG
jgi:hypothetical protein